MTSNVATIKLEEEQESVTEIQTYLETFNKEIEGGQGEQLHVQLQQVEGLSGGEEGGTYFVDQSGQYYYQANSDEPPVMTQVQIQEVEETDVQNEGEANQDEQYHEIEELENADGDEDGQVATNENNQVVINSADAYQTVTIVPSDTNPGEVSYVLIVQQPESEEKESKPAENETIATTATATAAEGEEAEGEQDLTVYDFEDNEDNEAPVESEAEDDKTKIVKFLPKKSQTITQAHMCNYCNYTSPKRLLKSNEIEAIVNSDDAMRSSSPSISGRSDVLSVDPVDPVNPVDPDVVSSSNPKPSSSHRGPSSSGQSNPCKMRQETDSSMNIWQIKDAATTVNPHSPTSDLSDSSLRERASKRSKIDGALAIDKDEKSFDNRGKRGELYELRLN
ncbi:hypothetical protein EAG_13551 [Camponotus floridanus]|uniref:Uncharacterized protein n=1 Tax=Camponotus floridanus TaxID=104421 RepID=E2ASA3_CAMFO|nr:hypothetical protein EAG_13551 [Camponotus floridanus]